jgi:hypothetical protein
MALSIEELNAVSPTTPGTDAASDVVQDRFTDMETYSEQAKDNVYTYLEELKTLFATASMPTSNIVYDFQNLQLSPSLVGLRPDPPSDSTPGDVVSPSEPSLNEVTISPTILPTYNIDDLESEANFSFTEPVYTSALNTLVRSQLTTWIGSNASGLAAGIDDDIWTRARSRQDLKHQAMYDEAENYFASRGFVLPPGALAGRLAEVAAEISRSETQLNAEITIEQARIAEEQRKANLAIIVQMEDKDKELFNAIAERAFNAAKALSEVTIAVHEAKVRSFVNRLEAIKVGVEAKKIETEVASNTNRDRVALYQAKIEKYKSDVAKELSIIETAAKVYGYRVQGYEADARAAEVDLNAQIEKYKADIQQADNQTQLSLKEAELTLRSYLGALELNIQSTQAGANVAAQIAASSLSAVSAHASLGYSVSRGRSDGVTHSTSITNNASIEEATTA